MTTSVTAAFLVALITLVLFGLTLPTVIARMNFSSVDAADKRDSVQALMRRVGEQAIDALGPLEEQTVDGEPLATELVSTMKDRVIPRIVSAVREQPMIKPDTQEVMLIVQRRYLDAMRDALIAERSIGAYSSETYRQVESFLDVMEQRFAGL